LKLIYDYVEIDNGEVDEYVAEEEVGDTDGEDKVEGI
jgi:hypothetical protein